MNRIAAVAEGGGDLDAMRGLGEDEGGGGVLGPGGREHEHEDAVLNHLYGGMDEPEMKIIDVFVCKLRKKLAQAGAGNLIGTVWGRGYMMREPVPAQAGATSQDVTIANIAADAQAAAALSQVLASA